jgi:hypothetical protein
MYKFINQGKIRGSDNSIIWSGIEIKDSPSRGKGVFATRKLPAGFAFPYGGVQISRAKGDILKSHSGLNNHSNYLVDIGADGYIDGHLRHYPDNEPTGAWPGMFCNEPSKLLNEQANAQLGFISNVPNTIEYHCKVHDFPLYIYTENQIEKGDEILIVYSYSSRVYKRLGYERGLDVNEQMRPEPKIRSNSVDINHSAKRLEHSLENVNHYFSNKKRKKTSAISRHVKKHKQQQK